MRELALCLDADEAGQRAAQQLAEELTACGLRCTRVALLLTEKGPAALREALAQREPLRVSSRRPWPDPGAPRRMPAEATPEGFRWSWQDLVLTVTLHPPFRSRRRATLRMERGGVCYRHSLDLACYRARTQSGRDLARRSALDPDQVERLLAELVDQADRWVAAAQERQESQPPGPSSST